MSAAEIADLDDSNDHILFKSKTPVLVDAYAPWCGPCKLIEPVVKRSAEKWAGKLKVVKYDVESGNNAKLKMEMLMQKVILSKLPSLILYQDGKPVGKKTGIVNDEELNQFLEEHIDSSGSTGKREGEIREKGFINLGTFPRDDYAL